MPHGGMIRYPLKPVTNSQMCRGLIVSIDSVADRRVVTLVSGITNVSFGSTPDERVHRQGGPHLGVKQTASVGKRTFLLKCLLFGVDRT